MVGGEREMCGKYCGGFVFDGWIYVDGGWCGVGFAGFLVYDFG